MQKHKHGVCPYHYYLSEAVPLNSSKTITKGNKIAITNHLVQNETEKTGDDHGMYLMENPLGSCRNLMSESGTFLFSSFSISESGLLIPEVRSFSESNINLSLSLSFGEEEALAEMERWHNRSLFKTQEEERDEENAMAFPLQLRSKTLNQIFK